MSKHILEGDSCRSQMVIFDAGNLPTAYVGLYAKNMAQAHTLIHMPHSATGGLIHLYLEEHLPTALVPHCAYTPAIQTPLNIHSGQLAFGGIESVTTDSDCNHLKTTITIPAGSYEATIYTPHFSAQTQQQTIEQAIGKKYTTHETIYTTLRTLGSLITFISALLIIHELYKNSTHLDYAWSYTTTTAITAAITGIFLLIGSTLYGKKHQIKQQRQQTKTLYYENFPNLIVTLQRKPTS